MKRKEEYLKLMKSLENTPPQLEYISIAPIDAKYFLNV